MESEWIRVVAIAPFWRYAVGPSNQSNPAIPFYTLSGAEALYAEAKLDLPWAGVRLYRRRWFRQIEVVKEYDPAPYWKNIKQSIPPMEKGETR